MLSLIALAGPTWERLPAPAYRNESALVIVLDLSRSMDAEDVRPSRLERARFKISDLLQQRKDGLTALVVYSNEAFTVAPLTDDTATISSQLPALEPSIMPAQGSQASKGLRRATELLRQSGNVHGNILLIADNVDEKAFEEAKRLNREGYRLFVLGIGSAQGAPIPAQGGGFLKDSQGNIVIAKLETGGLASVARAGGGFYKRFAIDDNDIRAFLAEFEEFRGMPKSDPRKKQVDQWADKGPWLLLLVLPLASIAFRRGYLLLGFVLLFPFPERGYAFQWQDLWNTPDQRGYAAYQQGEFEEAAKLFEDPEWKAASLYQAGKYQQASEALEEQAAPYNRGNALARSGRLQEALDAYNEALRKEPGNEDARFNRDLVEQILNEQQKAQDQSSDNTPRSDENQGTEHTPQNPDSAGSDHPHAMQEGAKPDSKGEPHQSAQPKNDNPSNSGEENAAESFTGPQKEVSRMESKNPKRNEPDGPSSADSSQPADSEHDPQQELQQANEQWLRRIPDDPGGLLRRKFKYQYLRNSPRQSVETDAW